MFPGYARKIDLEKLFTNRLFIFGLGIKLFLIVGIKPWAYDNLFEDFFISFFDKPVIDPWTDYGMQGGLSTSFPYGIVMLIGYTIIPLCAKVALSLMGIHLGYSHILQGLSSLAFDVALLVVLRYICESEDRKLVIIAYWLSPVTLYALYIHGQLDILPVLILVISLWSLSKGSVVQSGILLSVAVSAKISMIIALPMICIYIFRSRNRLSTLSIFLVSFCIFFAFLMVPYALFSPSFVQMVFGSQEFSRVIAARIDYGPHQNLFIAPLLFSLSLYFMWSIKLIPFEILLIAIGLSFASLLIAIPPAAGYFVWIAPFIAIYQIKCRKKSFLTLMPFYCLYLVYFFANDMPARDAEISYATVSSLLPDWSIYLIDEFALSGLVVSMVIVLTGFCRYGLIRSSFYGRSSEPYVILATLSSLHDSSRELLISFLKTSLGFRNVGIIDIDHYRNSSIAIRDFDTWTQVSARSKNFNSDYSKVVSGELSFDIHSRQIVRQSITNFFRPSPDLILASGSPGFSADSFNLNSDLSIYLSVDKSIEITEVKRRTDSPSLCGAPSSLLKLQLSGHSMETLTTNTDIEREFDATSCNLSFKIIPRNSILGENSSSILVNNKFAMSVTMDENLYSKDFFSLIVSLCCIHIEADYNSRLGKVELFFDGDIDSEDIEHMAKRLIPNLDDILPFSFFWHCDSFGLIQLLCLWSVASDLSSKQLQR